MTDNGSLNYFLGIFVTRDSSGLFLSQRKYAIEILKRAHMNTCNPCRTPVDTEYKLSDDGDSVSDLTLYHNLAGSLQYLTFTPPNISYAVQQLFSSSTTDLVAYSDADWAGCPTTQRSTSDYCVRVLHVPSRYQFADIFTKRLPSALFEEFRSSLSARCPPAPTAGEC
ncbi:ribonuclease H-like domain-containing protein [Tanacetum coccineum]